jgi:hypothetical protein
MSFLEYIVRPYQSPQSHGTTVIPSTPSGTRERATLKWGTTATMPTPAAGVNVECCAETQDEQSRIPIPIRIYQRGDPTSDNWVDVERPQKMTMKKKEQNTCNDNWDQVDYVASEINADLNQWAADFAHNDAVQTPTNCGSTWTFKNQ